MIVDCLIALGPVLSAAVLLHPSGNIMGAVEIVILLWVGLTILHWSPEFGRLTIPTTAFPLSVFCLKFTVALCLGTIMHFVLGSQHSSAIARLEIDNTLLDFLTLGGLLVLIVFMRLLAKGMLPNLQAGFVTLMVLLCLLLPFASLQFIFCHPLLWFVVASFHVTVWHFSRSPVTINRLSI